MALIRRPKIKPRAERLKAEKVGISAEMVKAVELLIHKYGEPETKKMLMKLNNTNSEASINRLLCAGKYPIPPELLGKYQDFTKAVINQAGFSVHNLYDIRCKSESMFITRTIVCYHFAITLGMKTAEVMSVMKYKFKSDIDLNVGRIENALKQNEPEFMHFWNIYQEYLNRFEPKAKKTPGRKKGSVLRIDRDIQYKVKKKEEWGD